MSLIEVMVAAALFGMGMAAILTAFSNYPRLMDHQRRLLDAAFVAQSTSQRLQGLKRNHPDLTVGSHTGGTVNEHAIPAADGRYAVTWVVTNDIPIAGTIEVRVNVAYQTFAAQNLELVVYRP